MSLAPTRAQLRLLRSLALERGETFVTPTTRTQASREIRRLLTRPRSPSHDRYHERQAISDQLRRDASNASRIRDDEVTGYGSSASWS